ncbi:prepilin-type N-terminal cleavage/methylation domain-containing protein [Clostridium pasteurianum]|uniref:Prepilin-type N-terminal cleavage/methylation domain-containing protein n=1 Tax=Clostridium pasteurianum BC1 TaxID=86416 RepID=R4KCF1_CLOPA|nr:prepilin-type N-terminal cleavage/methylation domain-containing protein [Clostridium pasteurianum]AGK98209.1 prepilin-type N-terminal cleavage/methylation domain-containing protein [Clostridium pasteurianum BC1]
MKNELVLNSNNIGVNTTKESLIKKKKKGFTLVELIAVIAILAILAAIIVPRVANYTTSANNAKRLADAKTIAQAAELYQTETGNTIPDDTPLTDSDSTATNDLKSILTTTVSGKTYLSNFPTDSTELSAIGPNYSNLKTYITTTH